MLTMWYLGWATGPWELPAVTALWAMISRLAGAGCLG
jgi:hypothetical protein